MSKIDDLNTAVANIQAAVIAAVADIQALTAQISTANAADDTAAIEEAVGKINTTTAALNAAVSPPAPTPAPTPAA